MIHDAGDMGLQDKLAELKHRIKELGSLAVAYSGGVDSTFLMKVAHEVIGDRAIAVTARSSTFPEREFREAADFTRAEGIRHIVIQSEELDIEGFSDNPVNRCYLCKHELFSKITEVAKENGSKYIAEGSNTDDLGDYRPGMLAVKELGVVSPLREAGLGKDDIRQLSRQMGLPTWDKPAFACLSSRFPYGQRITPEKLQMVDRAEQFLLDLGFRQVRVRHHGDMARIEVSAAERSRFFDEALMDRVHERFREIGFSYTALDLRGYRTGSMNEVIDTTKILPIIKADEPVKS
ncbi:MAG: ATP-dependent sacrificial sulfur transferase LarE [Syntrophales bacterium]|nr:ATP-dependent sacrificial sulfur transferase LarE [Syntrophales bacterium]